MDLLTEIKPAQKFLTFSIAYLGTKFVDELDEKLNGRIDVMRFEQLSDIERYMSRLSIFNVPDFLILEVSNEFDAVYSFVKRIKSDSHYCSVSIIVLGFKSNRRELIDTFTHDVSDIYCYPFNVANIEERLRFLIKLKLNGVEQLRLPLQVNTEGTTYRLPWVKRAFDVFVAGTVSLLLLPLFVLIAILIKFDSKGPIIYKSKRAGTGYKVFDFYKFRSMRLGADRELEACSGLNQYVTKSGKAAFIKIKNDPRVTKLGAFLRNTSLDELPQLFNVLRGDMSLVGNRPLPLYEAQELTSDDWAQRFLGPAGITGLWQVTKRGKSEMSDEERRQLDNDYASHFSFWTDLKILLKTVPALFQKEAV